MTDIERVNVYEWLDKIIEDDINQEDLLTHIPLIALALKAVLKKLEAMETSV